MRRVLALVVCLFVLPAGAAAQTPESGAGAQPPRGEALSEPLESDTAEAADSEAPTEEPAAEGVSLNVLLGRAAWYVIDFISNFSNVVSEETYVQDSSVPLQSVALLNRRAGTARSRVLKSDFLLVSVGSNGDERVSFRDVYEVDGQRVRDREQRLSQLFLKPSEDSLDQAYRIQEESARYNLGNMKRTVNNPVLSLAILEGGFQSRFHFKLGKRDAKVGPNVWVIEYQEYASPSMIKGRADLDLFSHGRLWVEADTGRVRMTEILLEQPSLRAKITTTFRFDERFNIAVPAEMREEYTFDTGTRVNAVATYDRFRRFNVATDENIATPNPDEQPQGATP
jgi:hypothetical protein